VVREVVREKLGAMLGVAGEDVEPSKKISELGVDSLMAIEVKNWVDKEFSVQVSVLDLTGGKTVDDLAAKIVTSLSAVASTAPSAATPSSSGKPYVCIKQVPQPKQRIVCFPYLGGSVSTYNSWKDFVPKDVEVWAWEPSAISEWGDLVTRLTTDISFFGDANVPVAFYGHSLGALVAFEVACRLQEQGKPVAAVIAGACGSPDQPAAFSKISEQWNDEALLALSPEALTTGLLQAGIAESTSLGAEVLRAEIFLGRRYPAWSSAKKFSGPVVALFGTKDIVINKPSQMESWNAYGSSFQLHSVPGGHLFIHDHSEQVAKIVSTIIA
jgi:surfactin synthase thioesterase subunit/acyl carrier protein